MSDDWLYAYLTVCLRLPAILSSYNVFLSNDLVTRSPFGRAFSLIR